MKTRRFKLSQFYFGIFQLSDPFKLIFENYDTESAKRRVFITNFCFK